MSENFEDSLIEEEKRAVVPYASKIMKGLVAVDILDEEETVAKKKKYQSECLIQPKDDSSTVHVFNIPKREVKTHKLSFTFEGTWMGFCHFENDLFVAGGF